MDNGIFRFPGIRNTGGKGLRKAFHLLLVLVLLVNMLPTSALAAWDGQGNNGGAGTIIPTGGYWMSYADERDILGYRFTVYDVNGNKLGYSVDIDRYQYNGALYRSYGTAKRSHIDLYRAYLADNTKVSTGVSGTKNEDYLFLDTTLPKTPTEVEAWLTKSKSSEIAILCEAYDYVPGTCYVICEPIILAALEWKYYAMTMAEYAVYQSSLYGWHKLGSFENDTYGYNIMRPLSGYFGRYLYSALAYPALGTSAVPPSAVRNDYKGSPSVLLGSNSGFNTAADILKYQVGMAVYTDNPPANTYTVSYLAPEATGVPAAQLKTYDVDLLLSNSVPTRAGYTFQGWATSPTGAVEYQPGDLYTDNADLVLYAVWESTSPGGSDPVGPVAPDVPPVPVGHFRFISLDFFDTLMPNSKWREGELKDLLMSVLSDDLSDTTGCAQVWVFTPEDYEEVHEWCLNHDKGEETNKEFLEIFGDKRVQ